MAATALSSSGAATKGKKARRRRGCRSSAMTMAMPKNLGWVGARRREWGRWAAELRVPRKCERLWIGTFATPKEAAHAYDAAIFCFYGEHIPKIRKLNFPTAPRPDIPEHVRVRLTMANIRAIAEKYAHALTNYIPPPPPPVVPEAAPQVVVVVPPPVDASIGSAPTANYGNVNETGVDILTVADCLLSFNPDDFDEIMHFANTA